MAAYIVLAIARQTWRELLRERVVSGGLLASVVLVLAAIPLGGLSLGQDFRLLADLGFASVELTSVLLVAVAGAQMLPREWERRTAFLVLSKPVSRSSFLLGKAMGLMAVAIQLVLFQGGVLLVLLALRHGPPTPLAGQLLLTCLQAVLVGAIAVAFSAVASTPVTLLATLALYVTGHNLDSLHGLASQLDGPGRMLLTALGHALPDFSLLDLKNRIIHGEGLSASVAAKALLHGLSWTFAALAAGVLAFRGREA
ncbi:MAG: ABC transporter permease [Candidatus Sericytochromatia bacterium]|nr:ABC transporter permease [Candidatus Sericytochromatia bacterium]